MAATDRLDTATVVVLLLGAVVLLPVLAMSIGFAGMMGYGGMVGWHSTTGGWWPFVGMLVPLAVVLALLGGGYLLVQRATEAEPSRSPAMEELRTAYARGDLTDEEFETRRNRLEDSK